jgi:hypothetical protein
MCFRGDQPRTMHFGRVKSGELYSVSPMATLGPTVREFSSLERAKTSSEGENEITRDFKSEIAREDFERWRVDSSRVRESTVWEFELDSGVILTVKSETNKESENRVAESVIPNKYRQHGTILINHISVNSVLPYVPKTVTVWDIIM